MFKKVCLCLCLCLCLCNMQLNLNDGKRYGIKMITGDIIYCNLKEFWVNQALLTYFSTLKYSMNYRLVSYFWNVTPATIKRKMLQGTAIMYKMFTQKILSPQWLTPTKIKSNIPKDLQLLFGSKINDSMNILVDGTDIRTSRPSEFDYSSLLRSEKSKNWSIRVLCYSTLNGLPVTTTPLTCALVTGRHNDSGLFDWVHTTNHENINDLIDPSLVSLSLFMFMFMFMFMLMFMFMFMFMFM